MATTVTLNLVNDLLPPSPVAGVLVRVNLLDSTFVVEGTTDSEGDVRFLLPAGTYDIISYKPRFSCPLFRLTVEAGDPEVWQLTGHIYTPPESADPNLCRVSGFFIGVDGHAARDGKLIFSPQPELVSLNDDVLAPGSYLQVAPDTNGYVEIDLIRNVSYDVYIFNVPTLNNQMPPKIVVQVPDAPSANLGRMMFPVQVNTTFSALTLALQYPGPDNDSILTTTTFNDGTVRSTSPGWATINAQVSDGTVVQVTTLEGKLVIRPLKAGVATVTMTRALGTKIVYLPSLPGYTCDTLTVTVTDP